MTQLTNLTIALAMPFSSLATTALAQEAAKNEKVNVIFLFSDQHRADVFSYTGHPDVQTPNFDRMAQNGVVFNRAYCQDAVSAPSRNSLFTGLYPRTLGLLDNPHVESTPLKNAVSIQKTFQENGYTTYAFGKRHLYDGGDAGWDVDKSFNKGESPNDNYVKWIEEQGFAQEFGEDWAAEFGRFPNGNKLEGTKYPSAPMGTRTSKLGEMYTMEAYSALNTIETIRKHAKSNDPFFCFCSFYRPHQPYNPLPKYLDKHDRSEWGNGRNNNSSVAMPASMREPAENLPPFLANLRENENGIWCLGKAAKDEQLYREYVAAYYALVEEIDYWVGEIFEELERQGMAENTIVVYASDHGDFVARHGIIEKAAAGHNVYEETLRVPFMFTWKNHIIQNVQVEGLVELVDIYPTLVDLAALQLPEMQYPLEGNSIKNTLLYGAPTNKPYVVSENWSQATIITPENKLAIWLNPSPQFKDRDWRAWGDMFFNYANDPLEVDNIYTEMEGISTVKEMREYYKEFCKKYPGIGKEQRIELLNRQNKNKK